MNFAGERYGQSGAYEYMEALGTEPADRIDEPIRTIQASPPPMEFQNLWETDIASWQRQNGSGEA